MSLGVGLFGGFGEFSCQRFCAALVSVAPADQAQLTFFNGIGIVLPADDGSNIRYMLKLSALVTLVYELDRLVAGESPAVNGPSAASMI